MGCSQSKSLPVVARESRVQLPVKSSPRAATIDSPVLSRPRHELTPAETVLTSEPLFMQVVSFMDGLPGLLREVKRTRDIFDDLPTAAVKHPRQHRALAMLDAIYQANPRKYPIGRQYTDAVLVAIKRSDVEALRWMLQRSDMSRLRLDPLWSLAIELFSPGEYAILETLLESYPLKDVKALPTSAWESIASLELLSWISERVPGAELPYKGLFTNAVGSDDRGMIDYILEHQPDKASKNALSSLQRQEQWGTFLYLVKNPKYTAGEENRKDSILESAVHDCDLTMVKMSLHVPFTEPPTKALELAAELGFYEAYYEIYSRYLSIPTLRALTLASTNGHVRIVKFILQHSSKIDLSEAMDGAAANGHLEVLQLLADRWFAKCTAQAMDMAATNGHLDVVKFLNEKRYEGCTKDALIGAAAGGHTEIVHYLLAHQKEEEIYYRSERLGGLVLHGYFDEWKAHRAPDGSDDRVLRDVMREAGAKGKARAIRFIYEWCKDDELMMSWAIDGAAKLCSVEWLDTVHQICGGGVFVHGTYSAVEAALDAEMDTLNIMTALEERIDAIKWLILHTPKLDHAMEQALVAANEKKLVAIGKRERREIKYRNYRTRYLPEDIIEMIINELTEWQHSRPTEVDGEVQAIRSKYTSVAFTLLSHGRGCDWVIEQAAQRYYQTFKTHQERQQSEGDVTKVEPYKYLGGYTYAKRAIQRNDVPILQLCYDLSKSIDVKAEPEFAFDDYYVTRCAIASGHIDCLQWCIQTLHQGQADSSMLNGALMYAQPRVADWLLTVHPQCTSDMTHYRLEVYGEYAKTGEVLEWLHNLESQYPFLLPYFKPEAIANSIVGATPHDIVAAWVERYPAAIANLDELMLYAVLSRNLSAVTMVYDLIIKHDAMAKMLEPKGMGHLMSAMAAAARADDLEMVEFLYEKFPGGNWYPAVLDAGNRDVLRIFRFFLEHGFASSAFDNQFKRDGGHRIRRLCYFAGETAI